MSISKEEFKIPPNRIKYPSISSSTTATRKREWKTNCNWYIQEKIDGSQFSFSTHITENKDKKQIREMVYTCGNTERNSDAALFKKAITVLEILKYNFTPDLVYHAEMITSKRHNIVEYERMPHHFVVVYDISNEKQYFSIEEMIKECQRAGLEFVPAIYTNTNPEVNPHEKCLELIKDIEEGRLLSILGGKPEGVVLKCSRFVNLKGETVNTKIKYVTSLFKEIRHVKKPTRTRQSIAEFISWVGEHFNLPARFAKGRQHLEIRHNITKDTPNYYEHLCKELDSDLIKEQSDLIQAFIENEYRIWKKPKNIEAFKEEELYKSIAQMEDIQSIIQFLLPYICSAARKSL